MRQAATILKIRPAAPEAPRRHETIGRLNLAVAWSSIALSLIAGAVIGLWSFGGPVPAPPGFETYDALPRRLFRLAHIAGIALPVLNLLYVPQLASCGWGASVMRWGCRLLLAGTIALPLLLAGSAFWLPLKYLLPLPVTALILAFLVPASGVGRALFRPTGE